MKVSVLGKRLPLLTKVFLGLLLVSFILCIYYWYHEGAWREAIFRFKYFLSFRRLSELILSFGTYSAIVFVLLQGMQVVFAPIPGEVTGFVGGYLFGGVFGTFLSTIGLILGSFLAFEISKMFGTRLVKKVVKEEVVGRFDSFVTHRGLHAAFVLFLIPGFPKDSLCYLLGLTHLRRFDFFMINLFGRLPGTMVLTMEGAALKTGRYEAFFILLAASILFSVLFFFMRDRIAHYFSNILLRLKTKLVSILIARKTKAEPRKGLEG